MNGTRYAILLRGVNVGGRRRLPMADLRAVLAGMGAQEAQTLLQSGNAVATWSRARTALESGLTAALESELDLPGVVVTTRTASELAAALAEPPLTDPASLVVGFLCGEPDADGFAAEGQGQVGHDRWWLSTGPARVVYVHYGRGQARPDLTGPKLDKGMGVPVTARNWATTTKLAALLG